MRHDTTDPELRFSVPLYTVAQAARIVDVPPSTLTTWAKGYVRRFPGRKSVAGAAVVTSLEVAQPREPSIPFVGLAEALVLAAVRRSGVPMQRVRPALVQLQQEIGIQHALASRRLYTDGAELMFDFAERNLQSPIGVGARELVVVRNGQRVFTGVIDEYLQRIQYGADGYAAVIKLPSYRDASVVVDPSKSFGAPVFERGGARLDDVLERFWAGDSMGDLSDEFGVPRTELEDAVRVASRRAA